MLIRVDDYPHGSALMFRSETRQFWRDRFLRFVEAFETEGCSYLLGISPGLCVDDDWRLLETLEVACPAMHGYDHGFGVFGADWQNVAKHWPTGGEEVSADQLAAGCRMIADATGVYPSEYIAPFNVFSQRTLDALDDDEFIAVHGGAETIEYGMDKLDFGEMRLRISAPPWYDYATKLIRRLPDAGPDQVVTLHWIFEPDGAEYWWREIARAAR